MAPDDWPEWLPSDWTVQIRKIDGRKVKCYLDPQGQKFYSKPQVFRHLKIVNGSTPNEKTNANGSTGDVSLEPDVPHTNEVGGHATRQATGSINKKSKETGGNLAGDGSSSEAEGSQRKDGWLPDGWTVEVKTRASGPHTGMKYKCFNDPISGRKFFSKPQVLNYLASTNGSPAGPRKGDKSATKPNKSQKYEATDVKKTESARFGYEVISSAPAEGLPPGWIKEIRLRNCGPLKKKDPFYVDPLSGYIFFSKLDALRYLDSGDIKKCAMRPLRKDMNEEDYNNATNAANLTGEEMASPTDPSKGSQTSEVLSNGRAKRKVRSSSGVGSGSTPIASEKDESDWLPEGWVSEVKLRSNGMRLKYFMESASGKKFYSKPQVLNYLGGSTSNSNSRKRKIRTDTGGQPAVDPDSSSNSETADGRRRKRSKKKKKHVLNSAFEEIVTASPAEGLPPGWIKEIRTRKYSTHERKDPYYTDPVSGLIFRSKLDALRYLETGDISLCAIRPKKKDADGNEITVEVTPGNAAARKQLFEENSVEKQHNAQTLEENHNNTDPKSADNTTVSPPSSGRAAKKIAQSRITSRSSKFPAAVPARSSKRLKGANQDPMSNDQTTQGESRDLVADDGRAVQEKQGSGVNVEKQAGGGGDDDLSYQLGDPSWTDQCLDFAVKTLTGEFPPVGGGRQTSGSFQEGSDGAETGVNETPTKVN